MVRIDIWDVQKPEEAPTIDCGFPRYLEERYQWGSKLGKGGFGQVRVIVEVGTKREFACKSISKRLDVPNFSPQKQAAHLDNIRREIAILRRLKGVLNVAQLKEALEDDTHIHIIMEYCKGGELWNCVGKRHYGEGTVASYMRAVLRTIAQCHAKNILHRDVKPGNFMLLEDQPLSPVKAIDFGLAVFFEPSALPRRDLGLEGTPWFMSPETLSSEVVPASDVWAAGVMAYQLLSGYLPFDDHRNREQPALSKVWKAILTEQVSFNGSAWQSVPQTAKDFVKLLLNKDPSKRPTAEQALQHGWLLNRHKTDRTCGTPLESTVVQRIQRYGQSNVLKRTIFELIAQEIIKMAPEAPTPDASQHSDVMSTISGVGDESAEASQRTLQMLSNIKRRKIQKALGVLLKGPGGGAMEGPPLIHRNHHSVHAGMEYFKARGESVHRGKQALELSEEGRPASVHGGSSYWRMMRATVAALKWKEAGQHQESYMHIMPRCEDERQEQRKAARLALDTSAHASLEYQKILQQCSSPFRPVRPAYPTATPNGGPAAAENLTSQNPHGQTVLQRAAQPQKLIPSPTKTENEGDDAERQVRGRHAYRQFIVDRGGGSSQPGMAQPLEAKHRSHSQSDISFPAAQPSLSRSSLPIPARRHSSDFTSLHSSRSPSLAGPIHDGYEQLGSLRRVSIGSLGEARMSSLTSSPGGSGRGSRDGEGSGRGRDFFGALKDRFPASGLRDAPPEIAKADIKKDESQTSQVAAHAHRSTNASGGISHELTGGQGPIGTSTTKHNPPGGNSRLLGTIDTQEMKELMKRLNFTKEAETVSEEALAEGLRQMGYQLRPHEMRMLAEQVDPQSQSGAISKSAFLASQLDWQHEDLRELWLEAARKVFNDLESQSKGKVSSAALTSIIRQKLPSAEVEYALEDVLVEEGYADEDEVDFDAFLRILRRENPHTLDQFEARLRRTTSAESLASLGSSPQPQHASTESSGSKFACLPSVAEER